MDDLALTKVEDTIDKLGHVIRASEDWAKSYKKRPEVLAKLIQHETRLERLLRRYFKALAIERLPRYINWLQYGMQVKAYQFDVIVDVEMIDVTEQDELLKVVYDPLQQTLALGSLSAETLYRIDLGLDQYNEKVIKATQKYVGRLVKDISLTTRANIKKSIETSISLGETIQDAQKRLYDSTINPRRAELIARTETVRAYGEGTLLFAKESNATGKIWELSSRPCAVCEGNAVGVIPIDQEFPSGVMVQPAHPRCRCDVSLVHDYS